MGAANLFRCSSGSTYKAVAISLIPVQLLRLGSQAQELQPGIPCPRVVFAMPVAPSVRSRGTDRPR